MHKSLLLFALLLIARPATNDAASWNIRYSSMMPAHPSQSANGWFFNFPQTSSGGWVAYVTTSRTISMSGSLSISLQIPTTAATFDYSDPTNTCIYPAHVRAYFERAIKHVDITEALSNYRWWAVNGYQLSPGEVTMTIPLTWDQWSDANGQQDNVAFDAALSHPQAIGLTFGGGCFYGHGVSVSNGNAQFILTNYQIVS